MISAQFKELVLQSLTHERGGVLIYETALEYHGQGWCRELWLKSLGLDAVLPPPEDRKDVKSAAGAAKAKKERTAMKPNMTRSS